MKNVVVSLLLHGASPDPTRVPACFFRASCAAVVHAGGRHTSPSLLWSPLPAVAMVSPQPRRFHSCVCYDHHLADVAWLLLKVASWRAPLSVFFSVPETTKSIFFIQIENEFLPLYITFKQYPQNNPFASTYLSEAEF